MPRLFFLHFWGYDNPETLAIGIKAALDEVNIEKEKQQERFLFKHF